MTTADKITVGVAIATALGVGALIKSWVDHLLSRGEKKVSIADQSVQTAATVMTMLDGQLKRVQEALDKAQQESEELRLTLAETKTAKGKLSEQLKEAKKSLQGVNVQLSNASSAIGAMQGDVQQVRASGGLGGLAAQSRAGREFLDSFLKTHGATTIAQITGSAGSHGSADPEARSHR
ncbi:hypothetical protein [Micromonospora cremea]|uniref:Uncharacterized protein n=1 Tax=Micromonospora cremea TaxID=709881 RepID=A0A1N5YXZ4_9ACTN|nr:hypothetical protein [Micromonospora cremea]SIN14481.1 hypothetical protein SAMN04489832_3415 [Micromonospora cremea]